MKKLYSILKMPIKRSIAIAIIALFLTVGSASAITLWYLDGTTLKPADPTWSVILGTLTGGLSDFTTTTQMAKGDIIVSTSSDGWSNLIVGPLGAILTSSSSAPFGIGWDKNIGTSTNRMTGVYTDLLDTNILVVNTMVNGNIVMGGNSVTQANQVKAVYFTATSTDTASTFVNMIVTRSTTTDTTTTDLYAATFRDGTLMITGGAITGAASLDVTDLTVTQSTTTDATSTQFHIVERLTVAGNVEVSATSSHAGPIVITSPEYEAPLFHIRNADDRTIFRVIDDDDGDGMMEVADAGGVEEGSIYIRLSVGSDSFIDTGDEFGIGTSTDITYLLTVGETYGSQFLVNNAGAVIAVAVTSTDSYATNLGLNSEYFTDLTGTALSNTNGSLGVTANGIGNTQLEYDTGQLLTDVASPTFAGLTITNATTTNSTSTELHVVDRLTVAGELDIPNNSVDEADISFSTACAAGSHYYLNGNDLACEEDALHSTTSADVWVQQVELDELSNVTAMTESMGDILYFYETGWKNIASSTEGQVLKIDANGYPSWGSDATGAFSTTTADWWIEQVELDELSNVDAITETQGGMLYVADSGNWDMIASSTEGYSLVIDANGYPAWAALTDANIPNDITVNSTSAITTTGSASSTSYSINELFEVSSEGHATSVQFEITDGSSGLRIYIEGNTTTLDFF